MLSCLGRLTSALLVIVITTFIALAAVALGALYLGFTPRSAADLAAAQDRIAQLESSNQQLQAQNSAAQTQIVQVMSQAGSDRETLDDLASQVQSFTEMRQAVETQIAADGRERATLVVQMRDSRESVLAFATAEAGRVQMLEELRRRSERVERFLQRLSDISGDAALDVAGGTATPADAGPGATPPPTPTPTPTPAPEESPTPAPEVTETAQLSPTPTTTPMP
jgi:hypothetical protein